MDKLLKSLGIDENADAEEIVGKLELKQSEIMERLDNVENEKRIQKLEADLKQIEAAITAFSWMRGKKQTGIVRDEDVISDDFSDLKGQSTEKTTETVLSESQKEKTEEEFRKAAEQGNANAQSNLANMRPKEEFYTEKPAAVTQPPLTYIKKEIPGNNKKEVPGINKKEILAHIKRIFIIMLLVSGIIIAIEFFVEGFGYDCGESIWAYLPSMLYTEDGRGIRVNETSSPYYISLIPLDYLVIEDSCENLSLIINPFGTKSLWMSKAMKKVKIHNGTEEVRLNCEKLKKLIIPDSVTYIELYNLKDELALTLELPEHLESFYINKSPELTDTGFQALEIPESVQNVTIDCDNLKNIDISYNIEYLSISGADKLTVNGDIQELHSEADSLIVNGDVQILRADAGNLTVNGYVQRLEGEADSLTVNGYVQGIYSSADSLTADGKIDILVLNNDVNYADYFAEFSKVPRALRMTYSGENELILPEGIEILYLYWNSEEIPIIPNGVEGLWIYSDTLDFDAVNIPEGTLYYKLKSKERNESREYQAENCPEELLHFDFVSDVPDLSDF